MRYLALCLAVCLPALAHAQEHLQPTAWTERVQGLEQVERVSMQPVDVAALKAEDDQYALTGEKAGRYAATLKANLSPENAGTWERVGIDSLLWRLRVHSAGAKSLNFGFDEFFMPPGGRLFIYSLDGKHVYRAFTPDDNEDHGQLWTPPVFGEETVIELTLPEAQRDALRLHLGTVNHDYRGFGQPGMEKSGACNIDIVCPISDPYNNQERAVAVISTGGSRICTGSLVNNTANDAKPFFMTAAHCGINSGNAASLVTFWNYFNSTCRPQGPGQSGPGNGSLLQFNTGSFFRAAFSPSDMTLVELDDAPLPAFNVYFAGWDRTPLPGQFMSTVAIHHPNVEEMRITFAPGMTESGGWPPAVPGDGSHIHAIWGANLGVTEPGSSGSPLYTSAGRYIGQLHGGPSACGAADLSDYYGRFSLSWTGGGTAATRVSNWLDPLGTGVIQLDGRNGCTAPAAPINVTATASALNTVQVTWSAVAGASGYNVYRAVGACPGTIYALIATNVAGTTFNDTTVSGGSTYAYVVRSIVTGCESLNSGCSSATATGNCTLPPTVAGLTAVTNAGTAACALNLTWPAGTANCPAATVKYNVYRSTTPGFTPSAANLRASCVTGTAFSDNTVSSGTTYYYVVRGEDGSTTGGGPCNGGNQDSNLVYKSGAAFGPTSTTVTDNVENGPAYWTTAGGIGTNVWNIVTTAANSPTHSWFVADPDVVTDQRLATIASGNIPAGFTMSFFHRFNTEASTPPLGYDGHVLEYSLDGATWTDILAGNGPIPANTGRFTQNGYNSTISTGFDSPLAGRQAWSGDNGSFQEVRVNMADFSSHSVFMRIRFATDRSVSDQGVWIDDVTFRAAGACNATESVAPFALAVDGAGNSVLQPGETAVVAPTWRNTGIAPITLTGVASNFAGPAGATYTITDSSASYGTIAVASNGGCATGGNCYGVNIAAASRPAAHWDSTILETVTPTSTARTWTLHVGDSFTDVLAAGSFYRFVETIFHKGVTGGCGPGVYCPGSPTTREQMAVFVLVSKEGAGYNPPACTTPVFADVPASSPFCRFIEELSRRGVVSGCGNGNYCPSLAVSRDTMAVFALRTLEPALTPPACTTPMFNDVPASNPFCRWIEELARRGVVSGCGNGNYCPSDPVTRDTMAVFLTGTFALTLYGL